MQLQNELIRIDTMLAHRWDNERYRYYEPIGKIEEFINLIGSGEYFVVLLSAANGVGKTLAGINVLAHLFWPCGNPYFQSALFLNWPYPMKGRIISDPTTVTDTIVPEMKNQFPKGRFGVEKYTATKAGKRYEYEWKTDTGWELNIMSYEQDVKEFEGATLGFAWFDEPPPQAIFKATVARMRRGGVIFITATPLTGSAWLYDEIVANPNPAAKYRTFIQAEVEEACKLHGIRGFLEHADIEKLVAQYDPEDRQARVYGKFQHLTGLILKNWNRNIHVIKPFEITRKDYVVINALDPHPRNPDAIMWCAIDRNNMKYICNELYGSYVIEEMAVRIKDIETGYRVKERIADPSAFIIDQHDPYKRSLAQKLSQSGLTYNPASKDRTNAIRRTRDALECTMVGDQMLRSPELYIFDTCVRTIWEIEHWQWQDWRGKAQEYKSPREQPVDKDDHQMENLGRILLENINFQEQEEETPYVYQPPPDLDPYY